MAKKIPLRQCVGCGEMKGKKEMLRVLKTPEDEICLDKTGRKNGRGAYICLNQARLEKAKKTKALERSLKTEIPGEIYQTIAEEMI